MSSVHPEIKKLAAPDPDRADLYQSYPIVSLVLELARDEAKTHIAVLKQQKPLFQK